MDIKTEFKQLVKIAIEKIQNWHNYYFNQLAVKQRKNCKSIPVIINNYNQLDNLKKLVNWLERRELKNITILDNQSDYPPLIEWYKNSPYEVISLDENLGHRAFWRSKGILKKYIKGYFILTDPDILPSEECPEDFLNKSISLLNSNPLVSKVGFSLRIDDIPNHYGQKEKVIGWENQFWNNALGDDIHLAYIDTTFALYRPNHNYKKKFYDGIRISGKYTCRHTSWYWDYDNLTNEQKHYTATACSSSQWALQKFSKPLPLS
jgi:hypothetical protein